MSYAFPGKDAGTVGALVYQLHHDCRALGVTEIAEASLQALHIAAHIDAVQRTILPRLDAGEHVVLDRYWWSTLVYGVHRGVREDLLNALISAEHRAWDAVQPLVVFLIDRARPWRSDEDTPEWQQLARSYRALAEREGARVRVQVISGGGIPAALAADMVSVVVDSLEPTTTAFAATLTRSDSQLTLKVECGSLRRPASRVSILRGRSRSLKATEVMDTYWRFAHERQNMFFRRLEGQSPPWTDDPILRRHRFTNAYRASDRVSQYLIRHVIYTGDRRSEEVFFRILLFKLFNKIETWELLATALGGLRLSEFRVARYEKVLDSAMDAGQRIYSSAYIMPAAPAERGSSKHSGHLRLLERMLRDDLPRRLEEARSMRHAFELIRSYPMMGNFLAYQYLIDLNYSDILRFSEMDFVVPGPGALGGLKKCFRDTAGLDDADVIRVVADVQSEQFAERSLDFRDLWGRPLQLVDCQNLFCEVDKYARVAHPEVTGPGGRTRIKRLFRLGAAAPLPWYPPKWGINHLVEQQHEASDERD